MMLRKHLIVDAEETPLLAKWIQDNPRLWPLVVRDMLESLLANGDLPAKLRLKGVTVLADGGADADGGAEADQAPSPEPEAAEPAAVPTTPEAVAVADPVPAPPAAEAYVPDAGLAVAAARVAEAEEGRVGLAPDAQQLPSSPEPEAAPPIPSAAAPVAQPTELGVKSDPRVGDVEPRPSNAARSAALEALRKNQF
jgi:pyruvate/2-oxoglutarate dehydrogenase complex dihydrolipoamide acyltransferase (E2) component